ncbi:unnamed protein product [Rotaria magnacalcarata]|uniref:Uncharacterized protein n=1 Tax=Rotaria magnacalcarata TaxID=392030 RepID=A0A816PT96_9BILA|nr:unnamed protein product [Rotaria magnacalcarata]
MPHKSHIWCSHPCHDKVSSDGKKRCSKIGQKPSHPKRKRSINEQLALYINSHNEIFHAQSEYTIRLMA